MILVDANILLYAYDATSPRHGSARAWLEERLSGDEDVGFALVTLLAFVRISTNTSVFAKPLMVDDAIALVTSWLARPNVSILETTSRHWTLLADTARDGQARGPLIPDAHLATLALEHGATICTSDRDFGRFRGVRLFDPTSPAVPTR